MGQMRVLESAEGLARAAATFISQRIVSVLGSGGARFSLGLSGGRTPLSTYELLATAPLLGTDKWRVVDIYFADERAVPPDHPESNFRLVRQVLIEPARIPMTNVNRIRAEEPDLEAAATQYETRLPPALDLLVLGLGEDGHTASIFPGSQVATEAVRRAMPVYDAPKPPVRRITLTPRVLREAREVVVLVTGEEKAEAVWRALKSETDPMEVPARLVREREWLIDEEASSWLAAPEG